MNPMRSVGNRVSVSDARGNTVEAGVARVRLKLSAIAYANSQIGIDASIDIASAALEVLCESAVHFWQVLTKEKFDRPIEFESATRLRVAALAYVNARHGVDATAEMARMGVEALCNASIDYCQGIIGAPTSTTNR